MALIKSAFKTSLAKFHFSKSGTNSLVFYLPAYGQQPSDFGYFFSGKTFEKLGITGISIENQYQDSQNRLKNEKIFMKEFIEVIEANEELQAVPKFIVGHSLGALYALRICQMNPEMFRGCVMINPLLEFKEKVGPFKKAKMFLKKNKVENGVLKRYTEMDNFSPEG